MAVGEQVSRALDPTSAIDADAWGARAACVALAADLDAARREAREALATVGDPAQVERALSHRDGPRAPDAPVGLAREARGALVVERAGRVETIEPGLEERLRQGLDRVVAEGLRARVVDGEEDPVDAATWARAVTAAGRALARARGAVERARAALHARPPLVLASWWVLDLERLPADLAAAGAPHARAHDGLARRTLDTRDLPPPLRAQALAALGDLDAARQGLLVEGDNARALRLLSARHAGQVQCAYLDPPFNTGAAFSYRDDLPSALWLAALDERLGLLVPLLREDAALFAHIDGHEKERLRLLLDERLHHVTEIIWRIGWVSGFKSRAAKFIRNHDTLYHYGRSPRPLFVKQYLPYPEGYVRRDGKPPTGEGYPLEDTWNCSEMDRLDSIQIKSFSREKVGDRGLTQKNEDLLARVLLSSSREGDLVLDPYAGSGTTAAVAHKTGRRWLAVERGAALREFALPRLTRVLAGDPRGVSARFGWRGGGAFEVLALEPADAVLENVLAPGARPAPGQAATLLDEAGARLHPDVLDDPLGAWTWVQGARTPVDLPATCAWLAGVRVRALTDRGPVRVVEARDAAGRPQVSAWARADLAPARVVEALALDGPPGAVAVPERARAAVARRWPDWEVRALATLLGPPAR